MQKFPTDSGIGEMLGDQKAARACLLLALGEGGSSSTDKEEVPILVKALSSDDIDVRVEGGEMHVQPNSEVITLVLSSEHPERVTFVSVDMPQSQPQVIQYLRANVDIFAWSPADGGRPLSSRVSIVYRSYCATAAKTNL